MIPRYARNDIGEYSVDIGPPMKYYWKAMKIISFLPSATEIACLLGLTDELVGITHECNYPPQVQGKPVVVRNAAPTETMTDREIDETVSRIMREGGSLYRVEEDLLRRLDPDLILTQNLCQVCAASGNEISVVLKTLAKKPKVIWLTPKNLEEMFGNITAVGEATGKLETAARCVEDLKARVTSVRNQTKKIPMQPRVFLMEWFDPIYCGGHWVPELIEMAGGYDKLARKGQDSVRVTWREVQTWSPEVLVLSPCGFNAEQAVERARKLPEIFPGWEKLPAVKSGRVYAVDAQAYFARPGPRLVDGLELLAHLIHPEEFAWNGPAAAYRKLRAS